MVIQTGSYIHQSDENFQEFLKAVGANFIMRKLVSLSKPTVEIIDEGNNTFEFITKTGFKNVSFKFTLGGDPVELDYLSDGTNIMYKFTIEDNKLVQAPIEGSSFAILKIFREFKEDELILTLIHIPSGTEARRFYKKQ